MNYFMLLFSLVFVYSASSFAEGIALPVDEDLVAWTKDRTEYRHDCYGYSPLDQDNIIEFNRQFVRKHDPSFAKLKRLLDQSKNRRKVLRKKYYSEEIEEFDLTEKERRDIKNHPNMFKEFNEMLVAMGNWGVFKDRVRDGKRIDLNRILKIGPKKFNPSYFRILDAADFDGDGLTDWLVYYRPPVSYRFDPVIVLFNNSGDQLWHWKSGLNPSFTQLDIKDYHGYGIKGYYGFTDCFVYDYDKDSDNDIIIANRGKKSDADERMLVFENLLIK